MAVMLKEHLSGMDSNPTCRICRSYLGTAMPMATHEEHPSLYAAQSPSRIGHFNKECGQLGHKSRVRLTTALVHPPPLPHHGTDIMRQP